MQVLGSRKCLPNLPVHSRATCLEHFVSQLAGVRVVRAKAGAANAAGGGGVKASTRPNNAAGPEVVALLERDASVPSFAADKKSAAARPAACKNAIPRQRQPAPL